MANRSSGTRVPVGFIAQASVTGARSAGPLRQLLMGTSALIGLGLFSAPAVAQSVVIATPAGGGTVTAKTNTNLTVTNNTPSGGGIAVSGIHDVNHAPENTPIILDNVTIEVTSPGATDGVYLTSASGNTVSGGTTGTTRITTNLAGGTALNLQGSAGGGNGYFNFLTNGTTLTGENGFRLAAKGQVGLFNADTVGATITGNGAASTSGTGIALLPGAGSATLQAGTTTISGFATGVRAIATSGNSSGFVVSFTGGSINASQIGMDLDAVTGVSTVDSQAAIVAPVGIDARATGGPVTVTTRGSGTIDSTTDSVGTGVIAAATGGSGDVTVDVGASIGKTMVAGRGIDASTSGTATGRVLVTVRSGTDVLSGGQGIVATSRASSGNQINIAGKVQSAGTAVTIGSSGFTTTVTGTVQGSGGKAISHAGGGSVVNQGSITSSDAAIELLAGGSITNSGTVRSSSDYAITIGGGIGTIVSNGTVEGAAGAIRFDAAHTQSVTLNAGSTTTGAITSTVAGDRTIVVGGALYGDYAGTSGIDTLTLAATGSMQSADLGTNDDSFIYQGGTISGQVSGGGGNDALVTALGAGNNGTLAASSVSQFETLTHQSGNLSLTGDFTHAGGTTVSAGTLQIGNGGTSGSLAGNIVNAGTVAFNRSNNITYAGTISGSGNLIKTGSGGLNLVGDNSYTGGTTVSAGSLLIGQGGTSGWITGDIVNNGSVTISRSDDRTISGVISGTGIFQKGSTNVLTLTANNSYTGATNVGGGTLRLGNGGTSGSVASSTINLMSGTLAVDRSDTLVLGANIFNVGSLRQQGTGTLVLTGSSSYSGGTTVATGTLQIGNGGTTGSITGNVTNDGTLVFNRSNAIAYAGAVSGSGRLAQAGSGTLTLSGTSTYSGGTDVSAGILRITGALAGNATVTGGALAGTGSIAGAVTIGNGGTLLGTQGQTLSMGSLMLASGGTLAAQLGAVGGATLFDVAGDVTLDGSLTVADLGGFGAGVYRLIDYRGTLTDNGLDITGRPSGAAASDLRLQTSVAGQVNLISTAGVDLAFWDGDAAGTAGNGRIEGGGGTWRANSANWTDASGVAAGVQRPQPAFAIFQGSGGTVTVNGSAGAIGVQGMQFAAGGYKLGGDSIELTQAQSVIRVGDGSAAGAAYDAVIASALTGAGALVKTDLGRLILTGSNSYAGGTTISAGTLQIGNGGTTGSLAGNIINNANLVFDRSDALAFAGSVSGTGSFTKVGAGTLTLTGSNSYTGGTTIAAGTLRVGDGGSSGSLRGDIVNNAALVFDRAGAVAYEGAISGSGSLAKLGVGMLTLTGTSSYTGGTTVSGGTLQIGNGGTAGSIAGNITVTDSSALIFNRADALTYAGAISGVGSLTQAGAGTLTLTGANSYTGGTIVQRGTLVGDAASIRGDIRNDGQVVFEQASNASLAGTITGAGRYVKAGAGVLTLAGPSSADWAVQQGGLVSTTSLFTGNLEVARDASFTFDQPNDGVYAGVITGGGTVKFSGGTVRLTGRSSGFSGVTTVGGGGQALLTVNGSLSGSLRVLADGTLKGSGTVGSTELAGVIAPGNSIGTITIAGNFVQSDSGRLDIELGRPGANGVGGETDLIEVTGTASLDGGVQFIPLDASAGSYTFLKAAGGLTGTFDADKINADKALANEGLLFNYTLTYGQNDVTVSLTKTGAGTPTTPTPKPMLEVIAGLTSNQKAVRDAFLASGTFSDDLARVRAAVNGVSAAEAPAVLDSFSGEIHASVPAMAAAAGRQFAGAVASRLAGEADALVRTRSDRDMVLWAKATGSFGTTEDDRGTAGYDVDVKGFAAGADAVLADVRLGAAVGYSQTEVEQEARRASADIRSFHLGGYAQVELGQTVIDAQLGYSWHEIDTSRQLRVGAAPRQATGEAEANELRSRLTAGRTYAAGAFSARPTLGLSYAHVARPAFAEAGAGDAGLKLAKRSFETLTGEVGIEAGYALGGVRPYIELGASHDFVQDGYSALASFLSRDEVFRVVGTKVGRTAIRAGAGLDTKLGEAVSLKASYDLETRAEFVAHTVALGISLRW